MTKVAGYRIRTGALPAFQTAVAPHQQGELTSQKDCLAEAITGEGGEWDAQRSAAALQRITHQTPQAHI